MNSRHASLANLLGGICANAPCRQTTISRIGSPANVVFVGAWRLYCRIITDLYSYIWKLYTLVAFYILFQQMECNMNKILLVSAVALSGLLVPCRGVRPGRRGARRHWWRGSGRGYRRTSGCRGGGRRGRYHAARRPRRRPKYVPHVMHEDALRSA